MPVRRSAKENLRVAIDLHVTKRTIDAAEFSARLREIRNGLCTALKRQNTLSEEQRKVMEDIDYWIDIRPGGWDFGKIVTDQSGHPYFVCVFCEETAASTVVDEQGAIKIKINLRGQEKTSYCDNLGGRCKRCNHIQHLDLAVLAQMLRWTEAQFRERTGLEPTSFAEQEEKDTIRARYLYRKNIAPLILRLDDSSSRVATEGLLDEDYIAECLFPTDDAFTE